MARRWINEDPEAGDYVDDFGGTHVYEETGMTLAEEFPEHYYQVAGWRAAILELTAWLHGWAQGLCRRGR